MRVIIPLWFLLCVRVCKYIVCIHATWCVEILIFAACCEWDRERANDSARERELFDWCSNVNIVKKLSTTYRIKWTFDKAKCLNCCYTLLSVHLFRKDCTNTAHADTNNEAKKVKKKITNTITELCLGIFKSHVCAQVKDDC